MIYTTPLKITTISPYKDNKNNKEEDKPVFSMIFTMILIDLTVYLILTPFSKDLDNRYTMKEFLNTTDKGNKNLLEEATFSPKNKKLQDNKKNTSANVSKLHRKNNRDKKKKKNLNMIPSLKK